MNERFHSAVEVYTLLGCYATGGPKKEPTTNLHCITSQKREALSTNEHL
jgi:hypothetical protein